MAHTVEIYSLPGCPHCKRVKSFFAKHGIAYIDYDLSDQAMVDKMVELTGQRNVPVIIIDKTHQVIGDDLKALQKLLLDGTADAEQNASAITADYDLAIIGAGAAGLPAALYAGRKEMNAVVIAGAIGGMVNQSKVVENYPGIPDVGGDVLMGKLAEHAKATGVKFIEEVAVSISKQGNVFEVETIGGSKITAKTLIAATGRSPRLCGAKNETDFFGKGLAVCTTCDGPLYKGKNVAVIGGGNTALDMALELAHIANEVHVVVRSTLKADEILVSRAKALENIIFHIGYSTDEIYGADMVEGIVISKNEKGITKLFKAGKEKLAVEGVFLGTGLDPNTALFANIVPLNQDKEIIVDENCVTSVPGFFAAGDSTSIKAKQIASSVGEGVKALLAAYEYLKRLS
ncbi:MAG TPA: FAD-dependent oxidoreductase [Methanocorpusculum sp.]|nr:FAD-dependent oxidoreductase [Methanocorpusculum sp.]